jgi:hypothetical protein
MNLFLVAGAMRFNGLPAPQLEEHSTNAFAFEQKAHL